MLELMTQKYFPTEPLQRDFVVHGRLLTRPSGLRSPQATVICMIHGQNLTQVHYTLSRVDNLKSTNRMQLKTNLQPTDDPGQATKLLHLVTNNALPQNCFATVTEAKVRGTCHSHGYKLRQRPLLTSQRVQYAPLNLRLNDNRSLIYRLF
jgi:hypothetical protein